MFEVLIRFVQATAILAAVIGFITLCVRVWWVGASVLTAMLFVLALIFLPPAHAEFYGAGNIDLDSRIVVENKDGTFSTEISFSIEMDGKFWLLPSVVDGEVLSEDDAIEHFLLKDEFLGCFDTAEECDQYANWLHLRQEERYGH